MIKFSSEQLLVLQRALATPIPPLAPPPSMLAMAPPMPPCLPPLPARQRAPPRLPPPHTPPAADDAVVSSARPSLIPLAPIAWAYLAVAIAVAVSSVAAPDRTLEGALLATPVLSLALGLHALALLETSAAASCLALACAIGVPTTLRAAPHRGPLPPLLCCAALAGFFLASAPRGTMRYVSAAGMLAAVAAGLAAAAAPPYQRPAWSAAIVALSIQSAISAGRFRGQRLQLVHAAE